MTAAVVVLAAALIAIGLAGILVPVIPGGSLLVGAGVLLWAWQDSSTLGWVIFAIAAAALIGGMVAKYLLPSRSLRQAGVPLSTQLVGAGVAIVGFFAIPVIGLFLGFALGVYLAELRRLGPASAWPSTTSALKAAGLSILVELSAAVLATVAWLIGVVAA